MGRVLVIDDEPAICWSVRELLTDRGHSVEAAGSVEQAREQMGQFEPEAVVLDVRLPGEDGLSALPELRGRWPGAAVIVMTAFGDLQTAVTALGRGAFEYVVKPFDFARLAELIERALAPAQTGDKWNFQETSAGAFIGQSAAMQAVFRQIALVAPTGFPVLVLGETGTGKEVAARALHEHSARSHGPFVPVCPAALNQSLIESELFGHVRGAFTGATEHRTGLFELAENGTIFLDEIADTPLAVQVKLLRVLETKRYCQVGSGTERATNARLIAATHRDLAEMVAAGTFREDLYHRLRVFTISLPPLRGRPDDLRPLVAHFLAQYSESLRPAGVADAFWPALETRSWAGNVRELRHAVDHAVVLARQGWLQPEHLPPEPRQALPPGASLEENLSAAVAHWARQQLDAGDSGENGNLHQRLVRVVEAGLLNEVLRATSQNRTAAARLLGLDRATLRMKLRQHFGDDRDPA